MKYIFTFFCIFLVFSVKSQTILDGVSSHQHLSLVAAKGNKSKTYKKGKALRVAYHVSDHVEKVKGNLNFEDPSHIRMVAFGHSMNNVTIAIDSVFSVTPLSRKTRKIVSIGGGGVGVLLTVLGLTTTNNSLDDDDAGEATAGFLGGAVTTGIGLTFLVVTGLVDLATLAIQETATKSADKGYHFSIENGE